MISKDDILDLLCDKKSLEQVSELELRELADSYLYCEPLQWLYLKKLSLYQDVRFEKRLQQVALQISNRRQLYYFLHSEKNVFPAMPQLEQLRGLATDYFGMMSNESQRSSLQELAAKLKAAREARTAQMDSEQRSETAQTHEKVQAVVEKEPQNTVSIAVAADVNANQRVSDSREDAYFSEENLKKCILEHKYTEALKILEALSLKNPKKSTYFATQIKFIQTILENNK